MCIYIHICVCVCIHTHARVHITDGVEILYELPVLQNNTGSEIFLHKSGAVRSIDWIFIIGAPAWR